MVVDSDAAARTALVPQASGAPFRIASADGNYLVTPDGNRILDAAGGAIVASIGHGRGEVADAVAEAIRNVTYVVPPFATPERVRLVERLTSGWLPHGLTRVGFASGGSESVDAAIRLARTHHVAAGRPTRWKVIGRELSYHGTTFGGLSVGGHANRRAAFEPMLTDFPKAPSHYCLTCQLGRTTPDCRETAADKLEEVILQAGAETVAAFIAEPIVGGAAGALVPPDRYWPRVREICSKYGVLLIVDEVMTGFGRTGRKFGVDHWGVTPDIMVGGKGLASGYAPMGGVYTTEEVVAPISAAGMDLMFYTFSGHPASCAAADKVLEIMEREDLVARSMEMGLLLRERLARLESLPNVAEARGLGLLQAIELVKDKGTLERFGPEDGVSRKVQSIALKKGVFVYVAGSGEVQDVLLIGPPFTVTEEEIETIGSVLEESIDMAVAGR